jgi:hypothetical protein
MSGNAPTGDTITVPTGQNSGQPDSTFTSTGDGIITGVEPAKTPAQIAAQQNAAPQQNQQPQTNGERLFTANEVEEFRKQEKDKVYGRLSSMEDELNKLRTEREAELAAKDEAEREAEEAARKAAEEEMDVRSLLHQTREEFERELEQVRNQAAVAEAMLQKERELQQLMAYREDAIRSHGDRLVPEIIDFISGDTPEQIDASVRDAIERSERIVQGALAAQQQHLQGMRGTRTTVPAVGPLEEQQEQRQLSDQDIRNMSLSEYAQVRGTLHQAGKAQFYGQRR